MKPWIYSKTYSSPYLLPPVFCVGHRIPMRCVWGSALSWKSSGTEDGNKGKSRAGQHRAPYGS
ncbi:hypothetical protein [Prevotella intermedia]|uniref:hypothetical protein n=1 Tax=Prevotella intermedia TaxID=28131 RepID=UPI000C1C0340|nr:hypothetical protein [Prevotella intermedia]ATV32872.1 hypothetical protein CTM44_03425 [Prevotella intermedia]